jgi:hypothetical protein
MATTKIDTNTVTREQIDRCTRIIDPHTMEAFYLVLSETQDLVEYKVQYARLPSKHYTCTCKAGLNGFANCKDGVCKHVKWAVAAADEYKTEQAALAERDAKRSADAARLNRIRKLVEMGLTHPEALEAVETHTTLDDAALVRVIKADKAARRRGPAPRDDVRVFSLYR